MSNNEAIEILLERALVLLWEDRAAENTILPPGDPAPTPEPPVPLPPDPHPDADFRFTATDANGVLHTATAEKPVGRVWIPTPAGEWNRYLREFEVFIPETIADDLIPGEKISLSWDAIGANNRNGLLSYTVASPSPKGKLPWVMHMHGLGMIQQKKERGRVPGSLPVGAWFRVISEYNADLREVYLWYAGRLGPVGATNVDSFKTRKLTPAMIVDDKTKNRGIAIDMGFNSETGNPLEVDLPGMAWRNLRVWMWS